MTTLATGINIINDRLTAMEKTSRAATKPRATTDEEEVEAALVESSGEEEADDEFEALQDLLVSSRKHRTQPAVASIFKDASLKAGLTYLRVRTLTHSISVYSLTRAKNCVRKHLDLLFDATSIDEVVAKNPPLSEEEMQAYLDDEDGIACTVQNFRVDFTRPPSHVYNSESRKVFVDSFLASHRAGQYPDVPIPVTLLAPRAVSVVYDRHMTYRRKQYKQRAKPPKEEDAQLRKKRMAANSRRHTVSAFHIDTTP